MQCVNSPTPYRSGRRMRRFVRSPGAQHHLWALTLQPPGRKLLPRHWLKTIRLLIGNLKPKEAAMNAIFRDIHHEPMAEVELEPRSFSDLQLKALLHVHGAKWTRRWSVTPSDLPLHLDRLPIPVDSFMSPHCISWQGHIHSQPWACALIPCLRGRDSDHVLGSFQPSDSTAAIRLLSSISLMKPSKLSDTSHSNSGLPSFCRGEKSRFTRHKWGDISSQFCSESTFFWSTQLKETEWVEVIYKLLEGYFQSGLQQFRNPYPKNNTHAQVS